MKSHRALLATALAAWAFTALPALAGIAPIFVSTAGTDVAGCGTSLGTACATIQWAYDNEALPGDEIRVMPGTYNECVAAWGFPDYPSTPPEASDRPVNIIADDFDSLGDNTTTIIDGSGVCDGVGNTPLPTVTLGGTGASLTGFTVTGGGRTGVFGQGSVTITSNLITGNVSSAGAGLYWFSGSCYYAGDPVALIENNEVRNNTASAPATGAIGSGDGGGVYIVSESNEINLTPGPGELPCSFRGDPLVTVRNNTIADNIVSNLNIDPDDGVTPLSSFGAGLYALTSSPLTGQADVVITQNMISGNQAASDGTVGFGAGLWVSTFGYGIETIEVSDNVVSNNTATADGGGISGWLTQEFFGNHTIELSGNQVSSNTSGGNGGGIDVLLFARDVGSGQSHVYNVTNNRITDNASGTFGDGGGMAVEYENQRTTDDPTLSHPSPADLLQLNITNNVVQDNTAGLGGGGVILLPSANGDPDSVPPGVCGIALPATAHVNFANNYVVGNQANGNSGIDPPIDVIGAGVLILPSARHFSDTDPPTYGTSNVSVDITSSTIAGNTLDFGFVGGLEIQAGTPDDACVAGNIGSAVVNIDRSIVAFNACSSAADPSCQAIGVGGPPPGVTDLTVNLTATSSWGHLDGDYEASLFNPIPPAGAITADPLIDPVTLYPGACSPVFAADAGYLTSPDINADSAVDGLDILEIAVAFGSATGGVRFDASADLDRNGTVDGEDLSFMSVEFGEICP